MWKNKHVITALLIAPVLALIAYFATDYLIAERPHAARAGASYELIAKSNCRYASGSCELVNGEFELNLRVSQTSANQWHLTMISKHELQSAAIAFTNIPGDHTQPNTLSPLDQHRKTWSTHIDTSSLHKQALQVAAKANNSTYYAEVPTVFLKKEP